MKLAHLQGLDLTFMCSYGVNRDSTYYQNWSKKIEEVLGHKNKISFWTNNLSLADYNKEMSSYDVYICPVKRQTGLGALTTAISLGIKCYCIGVNYDYFKKKELNIFSCLDLSDITKASLLNFDKDMRQNNILLSSEKCSCHQSVEEWENIYSNLLKNLS